MSKIKTSICSGLLLCMILSYGAADQNAHSWLQRSMGIIKSFVAKCRLKETIEAHPRVAVGLTFLAGYGLYRYNQYLRTKYPHNSLLTNPAKALQDINRVREQFCEKLKTKGFGPEVIPVEAEAIFQDEVRAWEQKSPLFLLGECRGEGFGACLLSRTYDSRYRQLFEERVLDLLVEKMNNNADSVHYVGFGSGEMFQDLVIIAKALALKSDGLLTIHLIDPQYYPFSEANNVMGRPPVVRSEDNARELSVHQDALVTRARSTTDARLLNSDESIIDMWKIRYAEKHCQARQLLSFLRLKYPNAQVSLFLHKSSQDYLAYLDANNQPYPDIIAAADIEDEMSQMRGSIAHYNMLCFKTLYQKPEAKSVLLSKWNYYYAGIKTFIRTRVSESDVEMSVPTEMQDIEIYQHCDALTLSSRWIKPLVQAGVALGLLGALHYYLCPQDQIKIVFEENVGFFGR